MELTIVIPTHNRSALLRATLEGLSNQLDANRILEVLVVSDGSTDDTPQVVDEFSEKLPVRLIANPKTSVSIARNTGLRAARGRTLLFLDDDVVPSERLILEHTEFHRHRPETEAVLLGYVTWLAERSITPFMRWYGEYGALFGFSLLQDGAQADRRYLYTCNISFKTEFLLQNHGLNEDLTVYEDHELGYRLAKHGMEMYFNRGALGYHNQSFTFQQACDRLKRYSKGFDAFLSTEAGQEMTKNQVKWKKRLAMLAARPRLPLFKPLRLAVDSKFPLPHAFYRLMYWYFATLPSSESLKSP
jgi:glycosyltransferase involved in cell wall biosynthesis